MSKPLLKSEWEVIQAQLRSEKAVLKELEKHYQAALKGIENRIAELMGRKDANLPHVIRRVEYQRMIQAQVKAALDVLHAKEYETISEYLNNSYTDAFVGTVYTLHHQGMPVIVPIDQSVAVKAVTIDTKLKSDLYTSLGVDLTQLKKTIAAEITRGIASGMLYSDMMRNIKNAGGVPLSRARTIVRTEAGRVQEQATMDAANKAKKSGANVVKQWSAILDGKTRDSHRRLDGQIRELDEPFTIGRRKAMHPHDFGVAEEDINCRCTMLTRARAALDEDELKELRERAVRHSLYMDDPKAFRAEKLPALKNFTEFKKAYLKAAQTVENTGKSGIIKVDKTIAGHASTPKKFEPNSVIDHIGKGGAVNVRSFYDSSGMKVKDIHTDDHGYPKNHEYGSHGEHAHDYEWDADGRLKNKTTREISKEEREGSGDIL